METPPDRESLPHAIRMPPDPESLPDAAQTASDRESQTPPEWWKPLPDAAQMRQIDRWAIEDAGVPSLHLMERAGQGVAAAVSRLCPDGPVAIVCGKGNNGGDGFVAARLLREHRREVRVIALSGPDELRGDARESLLALPGEPPLSLARLRDGLDGAAVIVDALLGTGFRGAPEGDVAHAIEAITRAATPVISVDVPSGVDASSGMVLGTAVSASLTVTFHTAKPGLWVNPGKAHAGEVEVIDIGIPRGAPMQAQTGLIGDSVIATLPRRLAGSTKFSSGHVVVVGGSRGLTGAVRMAAEGAMRAGAGYITACVPASLQAVLATGGRPEMMTRALADEGGSLAGEAVAQALAAAERGGAMVLGPGLGREPHAAAAARKLAATAPLPLLLDADGLNAHAERLRALADRREPTVLSPHAGELGRLLGIDSHEVDARRLEHARHAARLARAVVVLKGDDTLVTAPDGVVAVSRGGSPALASAGTGDVLSGVIGALLAQGLPPFTASAAGVLLHARAGRIAARAQGCAEAVIAGDVIAALPRARVEDGR